MGGSTGMDGTTAAGALWNAAADAMAWSASMREHASWTETKRAWATKGEAVDAIRAGTEECGRVVDGSGVVDAAAVGRAAEAMRHASAAVGRAAGAFARSGELCRAAAARQRRAAKMYARASNMESGARVHMMAERSLGRAESSAKMVANARGLEEALAEESAVMGRLAAEWGASGKVWSGDRARMATIQADMWEDAKEMCAGSAEMARMTDNAEQLTARLRDAAARAAEASAACAAALVRAGVGPGEQEAAAAWRNAMAEANRIGAEERGR